MTDDDTMVTAYLRRLRRAARGLPRARRQELLDQVTEHITQAQEHGAPGAGPAELRNVLERLGEPEDIAAAAGGPAAARPGRWEVATVIVLLAGGLAGLVAGLPGAGVAWLVGVVLLWASPRWRWPDKLLGTLVWPGGFAAPFLLLTLGTTTTSQSCSGGPGQPTVCTGSPGPSFPPPWLGIAFTVILVAAPVVVAVHLLRRAGRGPATAGPPAPGGI